MVMLLFSLVTPLSSVLARLMLLLSVSTAESAKVNRETFMCAYWL